MKKVLSLILALVFCATLFVSCKKEDKNNGPDNTGDLGGEEETPEIIHKTYNLSNETNLEYIKIHGRSAVTADGINCDNSASGIEFNAYIEGELKVTLTVSQSSYIDEPRITESYFTLYVDNVRVEERFKAVDGKNTLTLANFEEGKIRNIKLIKQTGAHCALSTVSSLEFTGYFGERPADSELFIEFIGDSLTVGYGNLIANGGAMHGEAVSQDSTQAFAYLTAEKLGADSSLLCVSGMGIAKGYRPFTADKFFAAESYYRDINAEFTVKRIPDVVVIHLGTNDGSRGAGQAELMQKTGELVNLVRAKYGKDVPIVWVHGMGGDRRWSDINTILQNQLGGEENNIYTVEVENNNDGGGGHPNLSAHANASETLAQFIQDKDLDK